MEKILKRHIVESEDGSPTIYSDDFQESYHSMSGARQESAYLFLENGLLRRARTGTGDAGAERRLRVLEYGFGTGLNALLTLETAEEGLLPAGRAVDYTTLEKYPLQPEEYRALGYGDGGRFLELHEAPWIGAEAVLKDAETGWTVFGERFRLRKIRCDFSEFGPEETFDVVYFDAFSPDTQPELWSEALFRRVAGRMAPGALLVTYSAKGSVKTALRNAGLTVHRIPGTGRKRHNVIAVKETDSETTR